MFFKSTLVPYFLYLFILFWSSLGGGIGGWHLPIHKILALKSLQPNSMYMCIIFIYIYIFFYLFVYIHQPHPVTSPNLSKSKRQGGYFNTHVGSSRCDAKDPRSLAKACMCCRTCAGNFGRLVAAGWGNLTRWDDLFQGIIIFFPGVSGGETVKLLFQGLYFFFPGPTRRTYCRFPLLGVVSQPFGGGCLCPFFFD